MSENQKGHPTTEEALEDFKFLYEEYYLEDDENLSRLGKQIKNRVAEFLENIHIYDMSEKNEVNEDD